MPCDVTYEELAAYTAGDVSPARENELAEHVVLCAECSERVDALQLADASLGALRPLPPPPSAILDARRAALEPGARAPAPEVMTIDDVADFLRLSPDDLAAMGDQLPAFELAGQIRVRRSRLLEWIAQRERDFARDAAASYATNAVSLRIEKGAMR